MISASHGQPPTFDGQVQLYETPQKECVSEWYKPLKRAIYINGQATNGQRHLVCCQALSLLQMCPVIGVFNQTHSTSRLSWIFDTFQSAGDKWQFHGPCSGGPEHYFASFLERQEKQTGRKPDRLQAMDELLRRNKATRATFHLLRSRDVTKATPIFAHSQGNLILCNALTAMALVDGPQSIKDRDVYAYGCPTMNWPVGIRLYDSAFTGDLIAMINLIPNLNISKVGLPTGVYPRGFISHDFMLYLKDDAQFVINRFRWGGWGITVNMDVDSLASALVAMGNNEPRLQAVFLRLDQKHHSNAAAVAFAYVKRMKSNPSDAAAMMTMKNSPLVPLLIRLMSESGTREKEKVCIDYLKNL